MDAYDFTLHRRLHHQDADRRLPRRRPSRGDVRDRADHGRARARARHRPDGAAPRATGSSTRSSRTPRSRGSPTTAATTRPPPTRALALFGYDELRAEQRARRDRKRPGAARHRHLDVHRDVRPGPVPGARLAVATARAAGRRPRSGCCPPARSRSSPAPRPHGQGHVTAWSQIAADALGVPFEDVDVIYGDTRSSPQGMDTYGSRSLVVGGVAVHLAAQKVVDKARKVAAHLLEAAEGDVEFTGGTFSVQGLAGGQDHDPGGGAGDVRGAQPARRHGADDQRRRTCSTRRTSPSRTAPTCARSRSTPRPAAPTIRKYVAVDDIGKVDQPADRRGPGARRRGPGHRPGAVRGGRLRRRRQPGHRHDGRLPGPVRGGPAGVRHRPDRDPGDVQPARRQGRRRGRHDRLDPGRGQRGRRRAAPFGRAATSAMPCTPERVWRAINERGRRRRRAAEGTIAYGGPQTATTAGGAE